MPVNLSIKNVPDDIAQGLRERATRNRRSLQKELLVIVEEAVLQETPMSIDALLTGAQTSGLTVADESTSIIRALRDGRDAGA